MVITFVCDTLGLPNNGTTIATYNQIKAMKEKGHEVRVVCPDPDKEGVPGFYVCKSQSFGPFNHYVRSNGVRLSAHDEGVLRIALQGADIAHCNMGGFLANSAEKLCHKEFGIPITCSFNGQAENYTNHVKMMNWGFANRVVFNLIDKHFFSRIDAIHYPTEFMRDTFRHETMNIVKAYVVSNGVQKDFHKVNVEKPEQFKDKFVILYTARYSTEKDHKTLLKAVKRSKYFDKIQLILAGEGPKEKKLRKLSKDFINPPVFGFHSRQQMVEIINYADMYCHPSKIDLEAISALEAIACGKVPLLSNSNRAAIRYFALTPNNLFFAGNSFDCAKKIDYWIEHPEQMKENSTLYLGFAKKFDFDDAMDKMEKMWLEVIKAYAKKHPILTAKKAKK